MQAYITQLEKVRNEVPVSYNVRPRFIIKAIAGDEVCTVVFYPNPIVTMAIQLSPGLA